MVLSNSASADGGIECEEVDLSEDEGDAKAGWSLECGASRERWWATCGPV